MSDMGRVRRKKSGRMLRVRSGNGYNQAAICSDGTRVYRFVHKMIVEAFIGPIPVKQQVNHKNGNKLDNRVENLEIVSPAENVLHAYRVLNAIPRRQGERHPNAKLTDDAVRSIRRDYAAGVASSPVLAERHQVNVALIWRIVNRRAWAHLD